MQSLPDNTPTDGELVALAVQDERAWADIVSRYEPILRSFLGTKLKSQLARRVGVDDLLQDVWVEARLALVHLSHPHDSSLSNWFHRIASRVYVTALRCHIGAQKRSVSREQHIDQHDGGNSAAGSGFPLQGDHTTPSEELLVKEREELLRQAIRELRPIYQQVVMLHFVGSWTSTEAAEALGIDLDTYRKRMKRALDKLQQRLGDRYRESFFFN